MHLANELLRELNAEELSVDERTVLRCRLARQYEQSGDYEAASEALEELPNLEDLNPETKAHALLRIGMVTGWIGGTEQVAGAQETAKDLISESLGVFEQLGKKNEVGEARSGLALCYWRLGAYDEARVTIKQALDDFDESAIEQRAIALLREGEIERASGRLNEALRVFNEALPLFGEVNNHYVTATFHFGFANTLNGLSSAEDRTDYADRALIEYAAASFHFEQAGHKVYQACVENNLGFLYSTIRRFDDAHEHLDRAQVLMTRLKDNVHLAQVDETRARVLLAEGRNVEAEKTARSAVARLEKGDALSLLAEALTTHGIALTQLHRSEQARGSFERAVSVAQECGDFESAGMAALALIEGLGNTLSIEDMSGVLHQAEGLINSQDIRIVRRLTKVAFQALSLSPDWKSFSLKSFVRRLESHVIKQALRETNGSVSKAARLLGFNHHQSLISLLANRHSDLKGERSPKKKRYRNLIQHPKSRS